MGIPIITDFAVPEKYKYLNGFGNFQMSEVFPGADPQVNNHPQKLPYGLHTEKISGSGFVALRHLQVHSYVYRSHTTFEEGLLKEYKWDKQYGNPNKPESISPNPFDWGTLKVEAGDWTEQHLLATNGDAQRKIGTSAWIFNVNKDMDAHTAFMSLDGEAFIAPQIGALDIQTEFGKLLVRQGEFAVIPRGVKYRVTLVDGKATRGYVVELYEGHLRLPELGIIGTVGLANQRDFQIPTAYYDGKLQKVGTEQFAEVNNAPGGWTIISRYLTKLWSNNRRTTPFDIAAWHGTLYPYKYDIARFSHLENGVYDHHDPSLFTVLTAQDFGKQAGTAVVDICLVSPRFVGGQNTLDVPYNHRNTMSEIVFPLVTNQDANFPLNKALDFAPFGASLKPSMTPHGTEEKEFKSWREIDSSKPRLSGSSDFAMLLIETDMPWILSKWAVDQSDSVNLLKAELAFTRN